MESIFTSRFPFDVSNDEDVYRKQNPERSNIIHELKNLGYSIYATIPKSFSNLEFMDLFENKFEFEHDGYSEKSQIFSGLGEKIIHNLEKNAFKAPWFYYIHLIDLHKGSKPFEEFDKKEFGNDNYDRTISSIDVWIGRIMKKINLENTIVIITSDHGEYIRSILHDEQNIDLEFQSMGEIGRKIGNKIPLKLYPLTSNLFLKIRKSLTILKLIKTRKKTITNHEKRSIFFARTSSDRYLYDDIIHIPLIFAGFGINHKIISQQVRSVDIFPTILELIGKKPINNIKDGKSLIPLFNNQTFNEDYAYLESATFPITKEFQKSVKPVMGLRTSKYKYFRKIKESKQVFLYDLENDPLEEKNIALKYPKIVKNMENDLKNIRDRSIQVKTGNKMNQEEIKKVENELKKLGYI